MDAVFQLHLYPICHNTTHTWDRKQVSLQNKTVNKRICQRFNLIKEGLFFMFHFRMQEVNFSIYVFKRILTETVGVKHRCKKEKKRKEKNSFAQVCGPEISANIFHCYVVESSSVFCTSKLKKLARRRVWKALLSCYHMMRWATKPWDIFTLQRKMWPQLQVTLFN